MAYAVNHNLSFVSRHLCFRTRDFNGKTQRCDWIKRFAKPIIRVALSLSARTHRENAASGGAELLNNFSADYCSVGIKVLSSWALWRLSGDGGVREWRRTQLALQHVSADLKACQLLLELGCGGRIYFLTGASNLVLQGHRKSLKSVQMYYFIICKICSGDHL